MRSIIVLGLLAIAGCGPGEPQVYPVSGTLKLADRASPLGCVVELSSQAEATKGMNARGEVGADGSFTLMTMIHGKEKVGAVVGTHKVVVIPPPASSSGGPPPPAIAVKYIDYSTSGLTFEVKPSDTNTFPITLTAK
ncbi:MAG: hypothetical protein K8U57_40090 [Planctomycetes bacterium]|nr:hypothetical protein [Planctomycetota bacterium]